MVTVNNTFSTVSLSVDPHLLTIETMTMIDTTQLAQDQTPYKPQRKMSATTISTSAMSVASSTKSGNCDVKPPVEQSNSLLELIAKDVVASIINGNNDADDLSEAEGSMCSKMSRMNLNLESIADMVLAQVEKQHKGSDYELRKLLRQGLSVDDDYDSEEEYGAVTGIRDLSSTSFSNHSGTSKSSSAVSSQVTTSTVSDISLVTGGAKQSVDIFHPNFWGKATRRGSLTNDDVGTHATSSTPSTSRTVHTLASSDLEQATTHTRASLQEFIKKVQIGSSDSDSDSSEASSVLSDITGLTGCFEDQSECHRSKKVTQAPALESKPPTVISKVSSTRSRGERTSVSHTTSKDTPKNQVGNNQEARRRVSFGRVHIRHYERIMCDNPSSTNGPSVGIGWQYISKRPKDIEEFERKRDRRRKSELILTRAQREKIIRSVGYTEREIAAMIRELNKTRFQRRQTVNNLGVQKMEETVELAKRQVLKALFIKKKQLIFEQI